MRSKRSRVSSVDETDADEVFDWLLSLISTLLLAALGTKLIGPMVVVVFRSIKRSLTPIKSFCDCVCVTSVTFGRC